MEERYKVLKSSILSKPSDTRYVIVDTKDGVIVDDANGYGYKSITSAKRAWGYKQQTPAERTEQLKRYCVILNWMDEHQEVVGFILDCIFYALKEHREVEPSEIEPYIDTTKFTAQQFIYVLNHESQIRRMLQQKKKKRK